MAPYRLTRKTMRIGNKALYRIQATAPIESLGVKAGDLGGWVESEYNLSQEGKAWIGDNAAVMDLATVTGNAVVAGDAFIHQLAKIKDNAKVYDDVEVSGTAYIQGNSEIYDSVNILGSPMIAGTAKIYGQFNLFDPIQIYGNAMIGSSSDYIYIGGPFGFTVYRTEDGHSDVPDLLPDNVNSFIYGIIDKWPMPEKTTSEEESSVVSG